MTTTTTDLPRRRPLGQVLLAPLGEREVGAELAPVMPSDVLAAGPDVRNYSATYAVLRQLVDDLDGTVTIPAPTVAHKGPHDTDASMVRNAADRLAAGYPPGGSNLTHAVVTVLRDVADAHDGRPVGERSGQPVPASTIDHDALLAMTYLERQALPARHHTPHFDGLASPHSWICSVCWDEGETRAWPCAAATAGGVGLAQALGLGFSW